VATSPDCAFHLIGVAAGGLAGLLGAAVVAAGAAGVLVLGALGCVVLGAVVVDWGVPDWQDTVKKINTTASTVHSISNPDFRFTRTNLLYFSIC